MPKCENQNCKREATHGSSFCILHDDTPNKDPQEFVQAFEGLLINSSDIVLLEGITFPNAFSFSYFQEKCKHLDFEFSACTATKLDISDFDYSNFNIKNSTIDNLTITNCKIMKLVIASCTIREFKLDESKIISFSVLSYTPAGEHLECIDSFFAIGCEIGRTQYYHHKTNKFYIAGSTLHDTRISGIHNDQFIVKDNTFDCHCNFSDISSNHLAIVNTTIIKPECFTIQNSNLYGVCFVGTNVADINFRSNTWTTNCQKRFILFEQLYLTGEISESLSFYGGYNHDISFAGCCEIYQQLKCNFEKRGNYSGASDFHYGEMETRRLSNNAVFKYISIYSWYKYISSYGQSYWRTIGMFFLFLILFSILQLYTGFKFEGGSIIYHPAFSIPCTHEATQDFLKALKLTVSNATLRQPEYVQLPTISNTILQLFEICLGPLLLSQIILSVRRKLRR